MSKRLFEAMLEANHRALAGDTHAGLHPAEFEQELPLVALTCVDARLNALLPQALGVPSEQFIWLRNAGNIITGPLSSTMRSLALACAVKGGKEIVVIGHTDCQVGKTTTMQLLERFREMGVERHLLPDNINEFFGIFGSDRQNVIKSVEFVRNSPLIGAKVPVQGLLIDIETGKLEWLVNGYESLNSRTSPTGGLASAASPALDAFKSLADFNLGQIKFPDVKIGDVVSAIGAQVLNKTHLEPPGNEPQKQASKSIQPALPTGFSLGEIKFPESKIGEVVSAIRQEISQKLHHEQPGPNLRVQSAKPGDLPPKIPTPQPLRPKMHLRKNPK